MVLYIYMYIYIYIYICVCVCKLNTPDFSMINRSQYGNECDFKHEILKYRGNNCFLPTKIYCLVKCINYLIGKDYNQQLLVFITNEEDGGKK